MLLKQKSKFTLIELVVVMAVVMMLITLLNPSLNKIRRTSRSLKCGQNQRAIGSAIFLYAEDSNGDLEICQWRGTAFQKGSYHGVYRKGVYLGPYLNADQWEENNCPDAEFEQGYDKFIIRGKNFIATEANYSGFSNYGSRSRKLNNTHAVSPSTDEALGWDKYTVKPLLTDPVFQIGGWSKGVGWNSTNAVFHGRLAPIPVLMSDGSITSFDQSLFTPNDLLIKATMVNYVFKQ